MVLRQAQGWLDWKIVETFQGRLRSIGYTAHSELTAQKFKRHNFSRELEHLIWKYKNKSALPASLLILINSLLARKRKSKGCQPKQKTRTGEENCLWRYSRGLRNQNGEHLINPCESSILETQVPELLKLKIT